MPWLVFRQATRIAAEAAERRDREALQRQAHLGWQIVEPLTASLSGRKRRPLTFGAYLRRLGLQARSTATKTQLQAEREAARAAGERVREAFRARGVRKGASG